MADSMNEMKLIFACAWHSVFSGPSLKALYFLMGLLGTKKKNGLLYEVGFFPFFFFSLFFFLVILLA